MFGKGTTPSPVTHSSSSTCISSSCQASSLSCQVRAHRPIEDLVVYFQSSKEAHEFQLQPRLSPSSSRGQIDAGTRLADLPLVPRSLAAPRFSGAPWPNPLCFSLDTFSRSLRRTQKPPPTFSGLSLPQPELYLEVTRTHLPAHPYPTTTPPPCLLKTNSEPRHIHHCLILPLAASSFVTTTSYSHFVEVPSLTLRIQRILATAYTPCRHSTTSPSGQIYRSHFPHLHECHSCGSTVFSTTGSSKETASAIAVKYFTPSTPPIQRHYILGYERRKWTNRLVSNPRRYTLSIFTCDPGRD